MTVACLPQPRYRRAFEPGCSVGELTRRLAQRCEALVAWDVAPTAVEVARERLAGIAHVEVATGAVPGEWPGGTFDLVVFSEIGYYFEHDELHRLATRATTSLDPGGTLIATHWLGHSADHVLHGDDVHAALAASPDLDHAARSGTQAFAWTGGPGNDTGPVRRRGPGARRGGHDLRLHRVDPAFSSSGRNGPRPLRDRGRRRLVPRQHGWARAESARREGVVIEACAGSAGKARAIGTSRALTRWVGRRSPVWTVHTDADSVVPEGWLHHQRHVAECGFAAVAGVVEVATFAEHSGRTARRHHYLYDGFGDDHPHVHGANLGVRSDAYRAVGGWSAIVSGEDHALWTAVRRAGFPTLSTRSIHVVTSGRRIGRAPDGFAAHLRALCEAV